MHRGTQLPNRHYLFSDPMAAHLDGCNVNSYSRLPLFPLPNTQELPQAPTNPSPPIAIGVVPIDPGWVEDK